MNDLFRAENIHKHFDGVHALRGACFDLREGEVHALIGENGAGKSTLGKIAAGVVQADEGRLFYRDEPVVLRSPLDAHRLGIGIIFQELDLFPHLSVAENIVIGNPEAEDRLFVNERRLRGFVLPFMRQAGLDGDPSKPLGELPIAWQQLTAIARALSMRARLIVMDEPTSSLSEEAVANLFRQVRLLKDQGVSVIYVSHKMDEILSLPDRITVLRDGMTVGTRVTADTGEDELITLMVGREISGESVAVAPSDRVLLSVTDLSTLHLSGISFDLHAGEIMGVAGLVGSGRSELGEALFGLDRIRSGTIEREGKSIEPRSPRDAVSLGIGLLPEDRKNQGLMMQMSVLENATLSILDRLSVLGVIRGQEERERVSGVVDRTGFRPVSPEAAVSTLSGGNQQKVLLSRWLLADTDILFLDDPTRGIDVGAKQDIYRIITDLARQGKGILFVSSELPELLLSCHRILVLHEGRMRGMVPRCEATQEKIMALAMRARV